MTDTQQLDLDAIQAADKAATKGPWTVELEQCDCSDGLCSHGTYVSAVYANGERRTDFVDFPDADWQFIIRARTAVPALVAEIHRLRAELAAARADTYAAVAIELEGIDFHPNAKATCSDLCRLLAGRFRRKGLEEIDAARPAPTA